MKFLGSISTLALGTMGAVLLGACSALVLSHFVEPNIFGMYQALESLAIIFSVGGPFALQKAIFSTRNGRESNVVIAQGIAAVTFSSFLAVIFFAIINYFSLLVEGDYFWAACIFVYFSTIVRGFYILARAQNVNLKKYAFVGLSDFTQSAALFFARLAAGFFSPTLGALLLSGFLGPLVGLSIMARGLFSHAYFGFQNFRTKRCRVIFFKYRRFVFIESWGDFLRPLGQRGIIVTLASTYGAEDAAIAALSLLILLQPSQVVVGSIVDVIRSRLRYHGNECKHDVVGNAYSMIKLTSIVTPFILGFSVFLIYILSPILIGESWQDVPEFTLILVPLVYSMMLARALQAIFSQFRKQGTAFVLDLVMSTTSIGMIVAFWISGISLSSAFLVSGSFLLIFCFILIPHALRIIKRSAAN